MPSTEDGQADVPALIAEATDAAGLDLWSDLDGDAFDPLQQSLSGRLLELLQETVPEVAIDVSECLGLPQILLAVAAMRVVLETVATALLIRAGKWCPDRAVPTLQL